jgi:hypothetical protein
VNALFAAALFDLDAFLVVAASWLIVRWMEPDLPGVLEPLLAWAWMAGAMVAAAGVILGAVGWLGEPGFAAAHGTALLLVLAARRRSLAGDVGALRSVWRGVIAWRAQGRPEFAAALALFGLWALLAALAAAAQPAVYDALSYRLPRISQWLQDGRVGSFAANDPRMNYMPVAPDLLMAWLLVDVPSGFRPAALAQAYGGALMMAATYGLGRLTQLPRLASLGAVALLFGMANVALQFTALDTDLFTAGELAAAFCLWMRALRRGEGSIVAGIGAGLALGSKGTMFYLLPGAAIWVAWAAWPFRPRLRALATTLVAAALSATFFALPVFVRNWQTFGGPFGPADFVRKVHGGAASPRQGTELRLNLESSFAQLFDPNSQPPGLRAASKAVGEAIARDLPESDDFSYENLNRRQTVLDVLRRPEPDADKTTFGVLALLGLAAGAATAAALPRRPGARGVLAWSAGIAAFWVFFGAIARWHPYGFRYYVLVAPWMAVVAAWWMQALPLYLRRTAWAFYLLATVGVGWMISTTTAQAGWLAATLPEHGGGYYVFARWREWAEGLDAPGEPLRPSLAYNQPVAAFYRLPSGRMVRPEVMPDPARESAEALMKGRDGWLIVPATLFMGREGDVMGRTWLVAGEAAGPFSIAAYRSLRPGEAPRPVVYRNRGTAGAHSAFHELLVRAWLDAPLRLEVRNGGESPCRFEVASPSAVERGELAAGASAEISIATAKGAIGQIRARFDPVGPDGAAPLGTSVDLAP